jgi:acetyl esterase/lipase
MIPLWEKNVPHFDPQIAQESPHLIPYLLKKKQPKACIIVCPGGGYGGLAPHEDEPIARWLNFAGVSSFVLHYRVLPYHHPAPLLDAQRAIRLVRSRALEFGVDPRRIGILGFSAGGHLASSAGTHYDTGSPQAEDPINRVGCRPDALVLCYPVITFGDHRHDGSRTALLGERPTQEMIDLFSNEKQVTSDTPTSFLFHTANDEAVPVENSLLFAAALSRCQVPYDLHVFTDGPHGVGLAQGDPFLSPWTKLCETWLRKIGFVTT